jgi:serine/threonine protein phosphatase 1
MALPTTRMEFRVSLSHVDGGFETEQTLIVGRHPSVTADPRRILWCRDRDFVANYRGKLVVFGHTLTRSLPPELSNYTPDDTHDLWNGPCVVGLDTGSGKGGFVTALELPSQQVYESR